MWFRGKCTPLRRTSTKRVWDAPVDDCSGDPDRILIVSEDCAAGGPAGAAAVSRLR